MTLPAWALHFRPNTGLYGPSGSGARLEAEAHGAVAEFDAPGVLMGLERAAEGFVEARVVGDAVGDAGVRVGAASQSFEIEDLRVCELRRAAAGDGLRQRRCGLVL